MADSGSPPERKRSTKGKSPPSKASAVVTRRKSAAAGTAKTKTTTAAAKKTATATTTKEEVADAPETATVMPTAAQVVEDATSVAESSIASASEEPEQDLAKKATDELLKKSERKGLPEEHTGVEAQKAYDLFKSLIPTDSATIVVDRRRAAHRAVETIVMRVFELSGLAKGLRSELREKEKELRAALREIDALKDSAEEAGHEESVPTPLTRLVVRPAPGPMPTAVAALPSYATVAAPKSIAGPAPTRPAKPAPARAKTLAAAATLAPAAASTCATTTAAAVSYAAAAGKKTFALVVESSDKKKSFGQTKAAVRSVCNTKSDFAAIEEVRRTRSGAVRIECARKEDVEKLRVKLNAQDGLKAAPVERSRPRVLFARVESDLRDADIVELLHAQNPQVQAHYATEEDLKKDIGVRAAYTAPRDKYKKSFVCEVTPALRRIVLAAPVRIGWQRINVYDNISVLQCYKCYQLGHKSRQCKKQQLCGGCGSTEHEYKKCTATVQCCLLCKSENAKKKTPEPVNTNHDSKSDQCPSLRRIREAIARTIDY